MLRGRIRQWGKLLDLQTEHGNILVSPPTPSHSQEVKGMMDVHSAGRESGQSLPAPSPCPPSSLRSSLRAWVDTSSESVLRCRGDELVRARHGKWFRGETWGGSSGCDGGRRRFAKLKQGPSGVVAAKVALIFDLSQKGNLAAVAWRKIGTKSCSTSDPTCARRGASQEVKRRWCAFPDLARVERKKKVSHEREQVERRRKFDWMRLEGEAYYKRGIRGSTPSSSNSSEIPSTNPNPSGQTNFVPHSFSLAFV